MKNILFFLLSSALVLFTACSDDGDALFVDNSSASLTIDGVAYSKAEDYVVSFSNITFNDEETFQVNGTMANGTDTVSFSLDIPNFNVATYTQANNGDEVTLSIRFEESFESYSSDPFTFGDIDRSAIDYEIAITASNEDNVNGTFSGTLMNSDGETVEVDGEFVAINALAALGNLID
ncbi:MAG: hypothetical protein AAF391_03775 [Bacteroidota bacterium]